MGNLSRRLREIDMNDIPVDRAGRPMFDADGKKLSIADRELKTAKAAHHWAVIERDKLREANTKHKAKINGAAVAELFAATSITPDQAKEVVIAIAKNKIPAVSIAY